MASGLKIGLALGSGGARGLAHAGVLEALEEAGIRPHLVTGTSMGAIVGALYAQDPDPGRVWDRLASYVANEDFASYWAPFVPRDENEARDPQSRLAGVFGPISFDDLEIPMAAIALDLVSGQSIVYTEGPLVDGIYASSAIPSVFPPVREDGRIICDGGGPFRVPVEACRELGADIVIAVDIPAFEETSFSTGLDMILRSNTIARQRLNKYVCALADFVIRPEVTEFHWADFGAGEACRARGYVAASDSMEELKKLLRWRRSPFYKMKMAAMRVLRMDR